MLIFKKSTDLSAYLSARRRSGRTVGFVPTMGALHEGHLDLVRRAMDRDAETVVSIFVNPTQFNDPADLEKYPRQPERDLQLLDRLGRVILFLPDAEQVYPPGQEWEVPLELGPLGEVMEGSSRPGHFQGVAQVVKRLLDLVQPDRLYMGQKDLQQLRVVRKLLETYRIETELVECPTRREADGLAMSSRNQRLSREDRRRAPMIFSVLRAAEKRYLEGQAPSKIQEWAMGRLSKGGFRPEYFQLVHADNLQPLGEGKSLQPVAICVAAWLGRVRLIDNLLVKP